MRALLLCIVLLAFVQVASAGCKVKDVECYVDTPTRILGTKNYGPGGVMSNEWCAQLCHDAGKTLAGTEWGNGCYCGDALAKDAKKANSTSECTKSCAGNIQEDCYWRMSLFKVECSGTPQSPPPQSPLMVNPCRNASSPFRSAKFCDATLAIDERIADMIGRMTIDEKIDNLGTQTHDVPSLGLSAYNWWSEATHGVASGRITAETPWATNFAFPITTGMSFNRSMWKATGAAIAHETRAFSNSGNGYSTFWAPVINLARDPRWGRNIETPGEDPMLSGEYAAYFVKGFQEAPEDLTHVAASACCKHYVANSMDDSTVDGVHHWRNEFDATINDQDMVDSYMAPFQACVEKGQVTSLMCSYNAVNGVPSCANDWLLTTVARGEWGFDGYITSDCDADADVYNNHHYTKTPEESVRDVLRAGTDVDCGSFVQTNGASALKKGLITEADIDERLYYLWRMRIRLGHFDQESPLDRISVKDICDESNKDLARDGVTQSAALIKNANHTLPFDVSTLLTAKVAVIGPNTNLSQAVSGYYGPSHVCGDNFYTIVDAVAQYADTVVSALGVPNVSSSDTSGIADAAKMAADADFVVMAVGTDLTVAREGHDTPDITLSKGQTELIEAVAKASRNPIAVIVMTATPLDISSLLINDKVGAILHAGQPSVQTLGLGDLIFGAAVPAGRMVQTIMPSSYAAQVSIFDFNMRPGPSVWPRPDCEAPYTHCANGTNPGRTHRFYTGRPVVPFGYGLSYTTFEYNVVSAPVDSVDLAPVASLLAKTKANGRKFASLQDSDLHGKALDVVYVVNVTNTGKIDADDVVLGFMTPPGAGHGGVPLQSLFAFERVHVPAGEMVSVWLYPTATDFTTVDVNGDRVLLKGDYKVRFGLQETSGLGMGFAEHSLHTHVTDVE